MLRPLLIFSLLALVLVNEYFTLHIDIGYFCIMFDLIIISCVFKSKRKWG